MKFHNVKMLNRVFVLRIINFKVILKFPKKHFKRHYSLWQDYIFNIGHSTNFANVVSKFCHILFLKNGPNSASFCLFSFFSHIAWTNIAQICPNDKRIDGVLGSRTRGGKIEGADESNELWWQFCQILNRPWHCSYSSIFGVVWILKFQISVVILSTLSFRAKHFN